VSFLTFTAQSLGEVTHSTFCEKTLHDFLTNLCQAAFEQPTLRSLLSEGQGSLEGLPRLDKPSRSATKLTARSMSGLILRQVSSGQDIVDQLDSGFGSITHCDSDGAVKLNNRRRDNPQQ